MKRSAHIRDIADTLEREIKGNPSPAASPELLDRLRFLATKVQGVDDYAWQQATLLVVRAHLFYSDRAEVAYPGGANALLEGMLSCINWMRLQAMVREEHPETDEM